MSKERKAPILKVEKLEQENDNLKKLVSIFNCSHHPIYTYLFVTDAKYYKCLTIIVFQEET